jgi:hypothetical protein
MMACLSSLAKDVVSDDDVINSKEFEDGVANESKLETWLEVA